MARITGIRSLDLAKSVFVVYGVDEHGKCQLRRQLRRSEVLNFFAYTVWQWLPGAVVEPYECTLSE
jgi:hypothetical protein